MPRNDAAEDNGHSAVEERAGDERGEDADGQIALRMLALLGRGRDGVEPNVGEEDDGAAGKDARPAVGHEGMPVVRLDEAGRGEDEDEDGGDLDEDEDVVGAGRLANAAHEDDGENHHDQKRGDVEAEVPAGGVEVFAGEILQAGGQVGGRDPLDRQVEAEPVEQIDDVGGEADADAHVGEGVLEDQVPADDPGDEFAEGGVGVGVGRAGNRNHRREFGVAEAGKDADDGDEHER